MEKNSHRWSGYINISQSRLHPLWKVFWQFLRKLNIELMIRSRNSWPRTCPGELKTQSDKHLHTKVHSSIIHTSQMGWRSEPLGGQEVPLRSDTAFPGEAGDGRCTALNALKSTALCNSRGWHFMVCNLYISKAGENTDLREKAFPGMKGATS